MPTRPRPTPPPTRWTPAQARALLDEQAASGQPISAFARRRNLDPQRLYAWRRRLATEPVPGFLEVLPSASGPGLARPASFELTLPSSVTLRFDTHAAPELVAALVRALRGVGA